MLHLHRLGELMGAEATCTARFKGKSGTGKARLETDVLQFRGGELRLAIPFGQISKVRIFFGATTASDLERLETLKTMMKPNAALWVIRPKGRPEISEMVVMAAGSAAGLVDVKVVRFSSTHTAEKFVIPLSKRSPAHE